MRSLPNGFAILRWLTNALLILLVVSGSAQAQRVTDARVGVVTSAGAARQDARSLATLSGGLVAADRCTTLALPFRMVLAGVVGAGFGWVVGSFTPDRNKFTIGGAVAGAVAAIFIQPPQPMGCHAAQ